MHFYRESCIIHFQVRLDHQQNSRRVVWYDPCEPSAIDAILRSTHRLKADQPYLLLDENMSAHFSERRRSYAQDMHKL